MSSQPLTQASAPAGANRFEYEVAPDWPQLPPGWNFRETPGIAADAKGHVYVFHRGDHPIMEFDERGQFVRAFGDGLFQRPHAIRIDPEGNIWVVDDKAHVVLKLDAQGRVRMVLGRWGKAGATTGPGEILATSSEASPRGLRDEDMLLFDRPTDVAFAKNGDIYVTDGYGNSRVVRFSAEGQFIAAWGQRGTGEGEFHTPHSIALDGNGRLYVGDRENYRLQVFDAEGRFIEQWKHVGAPWGLCITPDQSLYLCDGYNNRVLKLDLEGRILGVLGTPGKLAGQFTYVHQLSMGPEGEIYTAEILNWRAQKFVPRHA